VYELSRFDYFCIISPLRLQHSFDDNELELLQRISDGDEPAFRKLFDKYKLRLFHFVLQFTHSAADAEEIVQDTFIKLWQNTDKLGEINNPTGYIYTICRNLTHNYLLKASRNDQLLKQVWANMKVEDNPTDALLNSKETQALINKAVSELSEQKQKIFRLSREAGMNHDEIAKELGLSRSRVKNIIVEVLKHIKLYLQQHSVTLALLFWFNNYRN
jgi:RNA polymerase sigma-70 factor (ECF subfamily)